MKSDSAKPLAGLLLVLAVGTGIAGFMLLRQGAAQYQAAAAVRVVRDQTDLDQLGDRAPAGLGDAILLQNEAELIRSDKVLQKVIQRLDLNKVWGKKYYDEQILKSRESASLLKARVQVSPEPGAMVLRIQARSDEGLEATKLADALAMAYCEYRLERRQRIAQDKINALAVPFQENETKVRLATARLEKVRLELEPVGRYQNPLPPVSKEESPAVLALRQRLARGMMQAMAQSNQLALSSNLPPLELQKLEAQVGRGRAELAAVETALQAAVRQNETLRAYWEAWEELDKATRIFTPIKETVEANRRELSSAENLPAVVAETAGVAILLPTKKVAAGQACLAGAGVLLLAGAALFFLPRKPVAKV